MQRVAVLGLNHATAPLALRERLAFSAEQRCQAISRFRQSFPQAEVVLLSTCNRVELYTAGDERALPDVAEAANFLAGFHGLAATEFLKHWYHKTDDEAVQHLFNVAASLDSMVLGETQIIGQVRDAYETSCGLDSAGPMLHPLFQRAVSVGKLVMNQTALGQGRLSIASAAVDYAKSIFEHFTDKTVLSIGAGKMAGLVVARFNELHPRRLIVCNRDPSRALALAGQFNAESADFDCLASHLAQADIVVTSTGSPIPIITREMFQPVLKLRRYRPVFIIDIALPRDVEESVGQLENVYLYNIDDLQQVVSQTQSQRTGEIDAAKQLISQAVEEFTAWQRTRELGPVIEQLYARYHTLAQDELARMINRLPNVSEEEQAHLEELVRRIVNKILHDPVQQLKSAGNSHAPATQYLHAMNKLFRLDENE